jgi:hypothetical protein
MGLVPPKVLNEPRLGQSTSLRLPQKCLLSPGPSVFHHCPREHGAPTPAPPTVLLMLVDEQDDERKTKTLMSTMIMMFAITGIEVGISHPTCTY